jgi:type II secretory pathway pseudopilin PulG
VRRSDGGFTLIECMVAVMLLMILSSAIFAVLLTAFKTTRNDRARVGASDLASRELEIVRQLFNSVAPDGSRPGVATVIGTPHVTNPDQIPGGIATQPLNVGGVPYTVQRDVEPQVAGPGVSACDGGSLVAHPDYNVTVTVRWPNMGGTRPVVNSTILTPPKGVINDAATAYLAVKVKTAAGTPSVSLPVTVSNGVTTQNASTDSAGCAVVGVTTAGTYTVQLNGTGMVDYYGTSNPAPSVVATLGQLTVVTPALNYDAAAELDVTFTSDPGFAIPSPRPYVTLGNVNLSASGGVRIFGPVGAATVIAAKGLWPFTTGYAVWPGSCADANPAMAPTNGSTNPATVLAPGAVMPTTVKLTAVDITVVNGAGAPQVGVAVTATKPVGSTTGCQADQTLTLGVTDATGHLKTSLPNGKWQAKSGASLGPAFSVIGTPTTTQVSVP